MLITGLLIAAYITGQFASEILLHTSGVIQVTANTAKRGFLIIGWNPRAEQIVREIFWAFESGLGGSGITVLTEEKVDSSRSIEFESQGVTFVSGNTFDKKVLERIGAHQAQSVILLADHKAEDPDAKTTLTVLALRSLYQEKGVPPNQRPRLCAEVVNHRKMGLLRDAGADTVICHEDYGVGLLAQSAFNPQIAEVYQQLLSYSRDTCEIYVMSSSCEGTQGDIPSDIWEKHLTGKPFAEAGIALLRSCQGHNPTILIGLQRGEEILLNPRQRCELQDGDKLLVIAWDNPRLEQGQWSIESS
ncbi:MAG: NAD-binding protein [Abditibacteriales bacterium]|nr:NAD-binding protein [Abditibacteriales bacterium]